MRLFSLIFTLGLVGTLWLAHPASALVQDTDLDSLTDESETTLYGTDPTLFDTDGDGVGDGEEILDSTNPLDPASSHLTALETTTDPGIFGERDKRAWYFGRASGMTALLLFTTVVIFGLLMKSQMVLRVLPMPTLNALHQYLSLSALSLAVLHMLSFFFDRYLHINLIESLVPFLIKRDFDSALGLDIGIAVGLGILGLYLAIILVFTSLYRHKLPLKLWRGLHYLSFLFYLLIVLHGLSAGTDSTSLLVQMMYGVSFSIVVILIIVRIISTIRLRRLLNKAKSSPAATTPSSNFV